MDPYLQWALSELGLDALQYLDPDAKEGARRRGRILLGQHHPDRNPGNDEALLKYKAINRVLQRLEALKAEVPPCRTAYAHYPSNSPYGPAVSTRTTTKYFEREEKGEIRYDARKVVFMRPK